jgi:Arginyl-tRNA synthetase
MNIFKLYKNKFSDILLSNNYQCNFSKLTVEPPRDPAFGDLAYNAPLILSSNLKKKPLEIGSEISLLIKNNFSEFESVELVKPGFINLKLKKDFWFNFLSAFGDNKDMLILEKKKY